VNFYNFNQYVYYFNLLLIKLDCLMVINDNLGEYEEIIPSEFWLKSHKVPFNIITDEFRIYLPK